MRLFTVDEYHRLIQAGILGEDEAIELLSGWIVLKMSRNPPHDTAVGLTAAALASLLPPGWTVRDQKAITTSDSEPEPDVVLARGDLRTYRARHPGPADIGLVVEVADATLARDRNDKTAIYARAGIAVYWIVNLVADQVEVHTDPTGPDPAPCYRQQLVYHAPTAVPLALDGQAVGSVPVADLLP